MPTLSNLLACAILASVVAGAPARLESTRNAGRGGDADLAATRKKTPAARTPPMGWMSWNHFRCATAPPNPADAISEALVKATAAGLVDGGFAGAGYTTLSIDDCWQDRRRDPVTGAVRADPDRFPGGMAGLGRTIHAFNLSFGLYGDVGPRTCAGFPGNGGSFAADAAAMVAAGVDYFKADGCNAEMADLPALYEDLSAELAAASAAARPHTTITLSCSWPAYLPDARAVEAARGSRHPLPPIPYPALRRACHLWRNWNDVDSSPASIASISRYWAFAARFSPGFTSTPRPGAWHDPDELLVGEPAVPYSWQALQFALWCVWGAPLFLSADVRGGGAGWPPGSRSLALHAEMIAINQRGAGPARLVRCVGTAAEEVEAGGKQRPPKECALQAWARPLEGGAVAVVAANLGGGEGGKGTRHHHWVCVPVSKILRTAGRVWKEDEEDDEDGGGGGRGGRGGGGSGGGGNSTSAALCWRRVSLAARPAPLSTFQPWNDEESFPETSPASGSLCLSVPEGTAAAVVGRPCGDGRGGVVVTAAS